MGLKIIAEGVESEDQLIFLKKWGCDEYQGPLSIARTAEWQKSARKAAKALESQDKNT